jgi:hypothetical protein
VASLLAAGCLGISDVNPSDGGPPTGTGGAGIDGGSGFPGFDASGDGAAGAGGTGGAAGGTGGAAGGTGGAAGGTGGAAGGSATLKPSSGLGGDGFIATPHLCNKVVHDHYQQASYKAIHAGRDVPCGGVATYRAFLRFDLGGIPGPIKKATLRLYYAQKAEPKAGVGLFGIKDFGQLDPGDWSLLVGTSHGTVVTAASGLGWISRDVTADAAAAKSGGSAVAFTLRYLGEGEDPAGQSRWYGFVAAENGTLGPELVVDY